MDAKVDVSDKSSYPLQNIAYRLFGGIASLLYIPSLENSLNIAMMHIHPSSYISYMIFISIIVSVASSALLYIISDALKNYIHILPVIPLYLFMLTFLLFYVYPRIKANERMNKIEQEMVSSIGLMAILASTGMRLEEIITYLARGSGQFANDMKWVISKIEVVGMDTITALRMLEERSTGKYKKFITGLIDAYRIGNITEYLINTSNVMMNDKRSKIQKSIENMNLIGEMYIVMMIVFPILAIVMLVILGMLDSNGMIGISTIDMMRLLVYVFIPLIGIIMLIISDSMIGKVIR